MTLSPKALFLFRTLPLTIVFIIFYTLKIRAQLSISSFSPTVGKTGQVLTLNGTGFSNIPDSNTVFFGPVRSNAISATSNQIQVIVPNGAALSAITVISQGKTSQSYQFFTPAFNGNSDYSLQENSYSNFGFINKEIITKPSCVNIADIDNDGLPDITCMDLATRKFYVFKNLNTGNEAVFEPAFTTLVDYNVIQIFIKDLNADGKQDLVFISNDSIGRINYYQNLSTPGIINLSKSGSYTSPDFLLCITSNDLDKDGREELVAGCQHNAAIKIFTNASTRSDLKFNFKQSIPYGIDPYQLCFNDLDNDGSPEVVLRSYIDGRIDILKCNNNGGSYSFSLLKAISIESPSNFRVLDLNRDGKNDLAVQHMLSGFNGLALLINNSSGGIVNFNTAADTANLYEDFDMGDLNGDGKVDFAYTQQELNAVQFSLNNNPNGISYSAPVIYNVDGAFSPIICDVTNDGNPDIIVSNPMRFADQEFSGISLLVNKIIKPYISGFYPERSYQGDTLYIRGGNFINLQEILVGGVHANLVEKKGDSLLTVVVPATKSGNVLVQTSLGISEMEGFIYGSRPPIISGILPAKGKIGDTVVIKGSRFKATLDSNIVYVGDLKAKVLRADTNALKIIIPPGAVYSKIYVTTVHQTCESPQAFDPIFETKDSTFKAENFFLTYQETIFETTWDPIVTGDFDNDGRTDIVTSYSLVRNITGKTGDIQFSNRFPFTEVPYNYFVKDVNTDGLPDLLVASQDYSPARVYINKSTPGNFSFNTAYDLSAYNDIVADDFNGDGKPEIVGIKNLYDGTLTVYRNTSDTGFKVSPVLTFTVGGSASCTITEDFNNDNKRDIAVISDGGGGYVSFFKNTSSKDEFSFNLSAALSLQNNGPRGMAAADFDGDGLKDMVVCYKYNNAMGLLKNVSTTNQISFELMGFQPMPESKSFTDRGKCAVSDFNGDGKPDVVISNRYFVYVFKNISTPGNIKFENYFTYGPGGHSSMLAVADFDNDGLPDIARKLTQDPDPKPLQILRNVINCSRIDSLFPRTGSTGTQIKLYGRMFTGTSTVSIGGEPAANFQVINDSIILATVGKLSSGRVLIYTPTGFCAIDSFTASNSVIESPGLSIEWQRTIGGSEDDEAYFVQQTLDEGYISAGYSKSKDGDFASRTGLSDMWIVKLSKQGNILWKRNFGNTGYLGAKKMIQFADSSYLVAGYDTSGNSNINSNVWLLKLSANGQILWSKNYPSFDNYPLLLKDIISTSDGGFLVSCISYYNGKYGSLYLLKMLSNGNVSWNKVYNSIHYEDADLLETDSNYWVGSSDNRFPESAMTFRMTKTGDELSTISFGFYPQATRLQKLIPTKDGQILFVTKQHYDNPSFPALKRDALYLNKLDADFNKTWTISDIQFTDTLYDIKQLPDYGFIGVGTRFQTDSIYNTNFKKLWITRFDALGNLLLHQTFGGSKENIGYSIDVCRDSSYIIAGSNTMDPDHKNTRGKKDYWVAKLSFIKQLKFCGGYGYAILTTDKPGSIYQWQIDKGIGYTDFIDSARAIDSKTNKLALEIPSEWSGYKFRCLVDGKPAAEYVVKFENRWTGSVSNEWLNPFNWSCNTLPDTNSDVIIESGIVNIAQDVTCKSLAIAGDAIVNVKPGVKIILNP